MRHLYYPRCETFNRWRSFDAHFQDWAGSVSLLLLPIKEANTSVMTICNQCPLWLPRMQDLKALPLHWHSFPGWVREHLSTFFQHKGSQYIQKKQRRTIDNVLRLKVGYLNANINWTTRNAQPEIGPDGSSHTQRNPRVDRYGTGFGPPRSSGSGPCTVQEPNRTNFLVQTQTTGGLPGPVANTHSNPNILFRLVLRGEQVANYTSGQSRGFYTSPLYTLTANSNYAFLQINAH